MNEQELRAEFALIYADLIGDRIARFTFRKSGDEYHYHDVEDAFQMYKRAKLQSEQRIAELEAVQPSALKEKLRSAESHITELEAEIERLKAAQTWQTIETAPRDGRPVWVRGNNYGDKSKGVHACWAWFDTDDWRSVDFSENGQSKLMYLTDWMPQSPQPQKDE